MTLRLPPKAMYSLLLFYSIKDTAECRTYAVGQG